MKKYIHCLCALNCGDGGGVNDTIVLIMIMEMFTEMIYLCFCLKVETVEWDEQKAEGKF